MKYLFLRLPLKIRAISYHKFSYQNKHASKIAHTWTNEWRKSAIYGKESGRARKWVCARPTRVWERITCNVQTCDKMWLWEVRGVCLSSAGGSRCMILWWCENCSATVKPWLWHSLSFSLLFCFRSAYECRCAFLLK